MCRPVLVSFKSDKTFSTSLYRSCEACSCPSECQERSRKLFAPLWRPCEASAGQFKCHERSRQQFSPLWRSREACACLFKCRLSGTKPF